MRVSLRTEHAAVCSDEGRLMDAKEAETIQVYVEESLEHLADIEQDLLQLEKDGAEIDLERVNKLFRAAHSIKGGAGFIGLSTIRELAHRMENVLGAVRNRELAPNAVMVSALLSASDKLRALLTDCQASHEENIAQQVQALDALLSARCAAPIDAATAVSEPRAILITVPGADGAFKLPEQFAARAFDEGRHLYLLRFDLAHQNPGDQSIPELIERLNGYGAALLLEAQYTCEQGAARAHASLLVALACILEPDETIALLEIDRDRIFFFDRDLRSLHSCTDSTAAAPPSQPDAAHAAPAAELAPVIHPESPQISAATSIRVKVHLLELLVNLAGELVLTRNQLLQAVFTEKQHLIEKVAQRVDLITSELQETILLTRMQPIGRLLDKFPRTIRDVARNLGKDVEVQIAGREVELDRTLLESLNDPLTHLVRNAVDHGIEPAPERKREGKSDTGTISIRAFHEAGQVIIEVADDGRGLDPDRLAAVAVARGFISDRQAAALDAGEKIALIFVPGFSLAERVSELSGRGVGMDVVKTNIEKLGGQIEVDSQPGQGLTIRIKLPLTLAIIPAQLVATETEIYAIPQQNIEELLRVPAAQAKKRLELIGEAPVVRLRNRLLPLVRLADVFGLERTFVQRSTLEREPERRANIADRRSRKHHWPLEPSSRQSEAEVIAENWRERQRTDRRFHASSALNIAVVKAGALTYGLIVDAFLDSQEVVVKPLGKKLQECRIYAGATILGDGRVSLILDVGNLGVEANLTATAKASRVIQELQREARLPSAANDLMEVLLFSNPKGGHYAVPLREVVRIERFKAAQLECIGDMSVVQCRGASLPVFSLDETAGADPVTRHNDLKVIVFSLLQREMGLLAGGVLDTARASVATDVETFRQPGIAGSTLIDGKIALLVDFEDLVRNLRPQWFDRQPGQLEPRPRAAVILVVEDSDFFRGQIKRLLEEQGFTVLQAENGAAAWRLLQTERESIRLVVTDLEMPQMDGFELAERIRRDERLADLPLIALTTLADEADMERAKRAGIDDYQLKLDGEQLVASIRGLLEKGPQTGGERV